MSESEAVTYFKNELATLDKMTRGIGYVKE